MIKKKVVKKLNRAITDNEVAKKYPGSGMANEIFVLPKDALWLPSKHLYLNYTLGGGVPYGKVLEVFGGESSGKTLVSMDFGSVAHSLGGVVIFNDAEQSFDPHWAELNGLDLSRTVIWNETSIEKISDWLADMCITWRSKLVNNEPIVFIQDSIAALDCEANINSPQFDAKAEMGNRAKAIYKMLRIRNQMMAELGVISIFINQLRAKVGASKFEDPNETPGGKAMRFYAGQRLAFFQKKQIKVGDDWVGNEVSVRVKKNKVAPPRPSFSTEIYFNEEHGKVGFDKYSNLAELFDRTGVVIKKGGGSYYMRDEDERLVKIVRGEDEFNEKLQNDSELRSKLLKLSKVNTISQTRKKIERIDVNRYKVKTKVVKKQKEVITEDEQPE